MLRMLMTYTLSIIPLVHVTFFVFFILVPIVSHVVLIVIETFIRVFFILILNSFTIKLILSTSNSFKMIIGSRCLFFLFELVINSSNYRRITTFVRMKLKVLIPSRTICVLVEVHITSSSFLF